MHLHLRERSPGGDGGLKVARTLDGVIAKGDHARLSNEWLAPPDPWWSATYSEGHPEDCPKTEADQDDPEGKESCAALGCGVDSDASG